MTLLILEIHVPNLPPTAPNVEVTPRWSPCSRS
jgi:hypothetical protein